MKSRRRVPRIVVSACLNLFPYRYNGEIISVPVLKRLRTCFEWIPICPEVAIGLPVPRPPIRIVLESTGTGMRKRMIQTGTGRDLTDMVTRFSEQFLQTVRDVDGFVLKSRSPSCAVDDTKVFRRVDDPEPIDRTSGVFTDTVRRMLPHVPILDETRVADPLYLDGFLTAVYMHYRWRMDVAHGRRTPTWTSRFAAWFRAYLSDDIPAQRPGGIRWSEVWSRVWAIVRNISMYRMRTLSLLHAVHATVCRSGACGTAPPTSTADPYPPLFQWRLHLWQQMRTHPEFRYRYRAIVAPYPVSWVVRLQTAVDL